MLPLLRLTADGQEHRIGDVVQKLAGDLRLSADELSEMLPSGRQALFSNRIHWAKTYLAQAKLLEITRRAHFRITERGKIVLRENRSKIDVRLLERFPEFLEFKDRSRTSQTGPTSSPGADIALAFEPTIKPATPDELLRSTIADIEAALASELLDRILRSPPSFFENLIVTLLLRMGYGGSREEAGRAVGKFGDGGIDGVIDQDPLGLDRVYLQAKRYKLDLPVSEPEIKGLQRQFGCGKSIQGRICHYFCVYTSSEGFCGTPSVQDGFDGRGTIGGVDDSIQCRGANRRDTAGQKDRRGFFDEE